MQVSNSLGGLLEKEMQESMSDYIQQSEGHKCAQCVLCPTQGSPHHTTPPHHTAHRTALHQTTVHYHHANMWCGVCRHAKQSSAPTANHIVRCSEINPVMSSIQALLGDIDAHFRWLLLFFPGEGGGLFFLHRATIKIAMMLSFEIV